MTKKYNLGYCLNSDEIKVAANILANDDLQFLNSIDLPTTNNVSMSAVSEIIIDGYFDANKANPIFLPMVITGHDVLLSLVPSKNGTITPYLNDSLGKIESGAKAIALKVTNLLKTLDDNIVDMIDLSIPQQYANCCGLAVVSNIASINKAFHEGKTIDTSCLYQGENMEQYYQNLGDNYVAPFWPE